MGKEHCPPLDPEVGEWANALNADDREWFEERAAILQFDGMHGRAEAESLARKETELRLLQLGKRC